MMILLRIMVILTETDSVHKFKEDMGYNREDILLGDADTEELETEDRQLRYRLDDKPSIGLCLG